MDVELNGIRKTFGPVVANDNITLCIASGTIQGILGENGAGKSTLMKVLSGFIQADSGKILMDGREITIKSPADAIVHGVGMLHQDPLDFPPMKVIENFLAGSRGKLLPNLGEAIKAFEDLQRQFDFSLDPKAHVDSLTVGERQQLEILRLLWLGAKILILDEPTTGISAPQKVKLFETLHLLADQGKTIIFVSHKLEDVEQLCSRVAVLRRGELVGEAKPPYQMNDLVTLMFGKIVGFGGRSSFEPEKPIMQLAQVSLEDYRTRIPPVSLDICSREVIGLAGMEGSGQLLFLRACAGLVRPTSGRIHINGEDLTSNGYHDYMRRGVAYMPASRMEEGLIPGLTLDEHFALTREQQGFFIDWDKCQGITKEQISSYNIRGRPNSTVESLSGGNQQRALLALMRSPASLILMEHPTRGLDIESALYIWSLLKERCSQGSAILFISADLDEILQYSDRILVFFAGRISEPLNAAETSVEQLGYLIGGKGF